VDLAVTPSEFDQWRLFEVEGELDMATAPILGKHVEEALSDGATHLLIDLTKVSFMDSSGIRLLLDLQEHTPQNGRMAVVAPNGPVSKLLQLTGMGHRIPIFESVGQAAID
jgi:anti-anti-sigma factor